ncbi:MAG: 4-hydroxy-tetrahydrodipicolinate reductase [Clostridia bacterium]|nr:4-hydroxy-tetrahydrodipicolinate reductase [Clostridia bacterium]
MKILLSGALGKMGRVITAEIEKHQSLSVCAFVDVGYESTDTAHFDKMPKENVGADIIVDFSHHSAIFDIAEYAKKFSIPAVICTTGQTESEIECIKELSKEVPVFFSANMSMGIALTVELAKKSAALFPDADIEIIEKHHSAKLDSPSGTALMLAQAIKSVRENLTLMLGRNGRRVREKNEVGIHAIRAGSIVGEHEVILATEHEIITVSHAAMSRSVFADGAINASKWLIGKERGLYTMQSLVNDRKD